MDGYFMTLVENKGMPLGIKLHTPMFGTCETGNIVHGKIYQDDREIQLIRLKQMYHKQFQIFQDYPNIYQV